MKTPRFPLSERCRNAHDLAARIGHHPEWLLSVLNHWCGDDQVLLSGSLVEGLGNRLSDLDVFLITTREDTRDSVFLWREANLWVDVTYVSAARVAALCAAFGEPQKLIAPWGSHSSPALSDLDLFHRLCIGVQVGQNAAEMPRFDWTRLAAESAYSSIVAARARWVDGIGALLDDQDAQAVIALSVCFGHAVDAYCALHGETNPSPKWRYARLARLAHRGSDPLHLWPAVRRVRPHLAASRLAVERYARWIAVVLFLVMQQFFQRRTLLVPRARLPLASRFEAIGQEDFVVDAIGRAVPMRRRELRPFSAWQDLA